MCIRDRAEPPGYASPLYPAAGIALAATLTFGRAALPGVLLGSFFVNGALGALRGQAGPALLVLPLVIGAGATLQAGVGAALVRRFVGLPASLPAPRGIQLSGGLGGGHGVAPVPADVVGGVWPGSPEANRPDGVAMG